MVLETSLRRFQNRSINNWEKVENQSFWSFWPIVHQAIVLLSLLLTIDRILILFWCFHCWLWISKCWLEFVSFGNKHLKCCKGYWGCKDYFSLQTSVAHLEEHMSMFYFYFENFFHESLMLVMVAKIIVFFLQRIKVTVITNITVWKVSVFGVFLGRIFAHLDWIQRDKRVCSPNAGKYGQKNSEYGNFSHSTCICYSIHLCFYCSCLFMFWNWQKQSPEGVL